MEDTEEHEVFSGLEVQAHEGQGGIWKKPTWIY